MADLRTSFPVLEDVSTQAGLPLHKVAEGDAAASKNALAALVAKDASDNLIYLNVDAAGNLLVSDSKDYTSLGDTGSVAGNTSSFQDVVTLTLVVEKVYENINFIAGCFRDAIYQIVQVDDTTTTIIAEGILVGSGAFSFAQELPGLTFTAGATGVQTLKLQAKNLTVESNCRGTLTVNELI